MSVKEDLEKLIIDPSLSMVSSYHDAGSCWRLIDAAIVELRRQRSALRGVTKDAELTEDAIDEIWLICNTMTGWGYEEVRNMPAGERWIWAKKCKELQEECQWRSKR